MDNTELIKAVLEIAHELRAVIGEQELRLHGQQVGERLQGDGGVAAGSGIGRKGNGKAAGGVDKGEQVAADAVAQAHHGIAGKQGQYQGGDGNPVKPDYRLGQQTP